MGLGSVGVNVRAEVEFRVGGGFRIATERPNGEKWTCSGTYREHLQRGSGMVY
jgi:hypothetical protein